MTQLLFDTPWWLPAALAGVGLYLFWTGNRRGEAKVRTAGLGFLAGAIAVIAVSYFVDTAVEKCVKNTRELVSAVEKRDWPKLNTLLSPNVRLSVLGFGDRYGNRTELVTAARDAVDRYGVKNVRVLSTDTEESDTLISVTMLIMSEQDFTQGRPITTSWKFEWQRNGNVWALEQMTCLKIGNLTGENAARQFPQPR